MLMKKVSWATFLVLVLPLLVTIPVAFLPIVNAHTPPQAVSTTALINVYPNVTGVNQPVKIDISLDKAPPTATASGGDRWQGLEVTITKPDGAIERLGPFISDQYGGTHLVYTPAMTGIYTLILRYPGQVLQLQNPAFNGLPGVNSDYINDTFLSSISAPVTFAVQQQPVGGSPTPSPTPQPTSQTIATYTSVTASPNPVGVNQQVTIEAWVSPTPPTDTINGGGKWQNLTVTIVRPDGTKETRGPFTSNSSGATSLLFTPPQVGTYSLTSNFPGQKLTLNYVSTWFSPSNSNPTKLTVQQTPVTPSPTFSPTPQPTTTPSPTPSPQPAAKPSVPQFTLRFLPSPYTLTTTDPYTGANNSHQIESNAIEITIKNQLKYSANSDSDISLHYNIRVKGHFGDSWNELYYSSNYPAQSNSEYTVLSNPEGYPVGGQIDFQVEAIVERESRVYDSNSNPPTYHTVFTVEATSDWSSTQTITIPETAPQDMADVSPTPSLQPDQILTPNSPNPNDIGSEPPSTNTNSEINSPTAPPTETNWVSITIVGAMIALIVAVSVVVFWIRRSKVMH
jgi:hypothetical protein